MIDIVQAGRRRLQEMHAAKRVAEEGKRQAQAAGFVTAWRALKKAVCDQLPAFLLAYLPLDSLAPGETMHPGSEPRIALTIPGLAPMAAVFVSISGQGYQLDRYLVARVALEWDLERYQVAVFSDVFDHDGDFDIRRADDLELALGTARENWLEVEATNCLIPTTAEYQYFQAFKKYLADLHQVTEHNYQVFQEAQARYDEEVILYEVRYGVVATDKDGQPFIEVRKALALDPEPLPSGFWQIVTRGGREQQVRFAYVVSVTRTTILPSEEPRYCRQVPLPHTDETIYVNPLLTDAEVMAIKAALTARLRPLPERLRYEEFGLNSEQAARIEEAEGWLENV